MSTRTLLSTALIRAARQATISSSRRTLSQTAAFSLKESASSDANVDNEKHKQDSLSKQKQGKGHWKPELASDSEESIKADRSGADGSAADAIKRLQERTKGHAEEKNKAGTSMHDGL
ncbi:hypothetical protein B0T22DRAFT_484070 [Podospora appendiculata]|uniref:Mitochondrial carrier protein pet8 n=1 Tax=Podospora appendiculata TaxID=314037 RepID=A0AAE1C9M5_9PEZI|nr:hypothetical protein B0T22DRAFT_484070 [Podospora appendiculata]